MTEEVGEGSCWRLVLEEVSNGLESQREGGKMGGCAGLGMLAVEARFGGFWTLLGRGDLG